MNPTPKNTGEESVRILADAVSLAIRENSGDQRFLDLKRIPLICLSIAGMHDDLKEIKDMIKEDRLSSAEAHETFLTKESFAQQIWPIRSIVYGLVSMILVAVAAAVISMVVIEKAS